MQSQSDSTISCQPLHQWPCNHYWGKILQHSWLPLVMSFCCSYTSSVYKQQQCSYTLLAQLYFAYSPLTNQMEVFTTKPT